VSELCSPPERTYDLGLAYMVDDAVIRLVVGHTCRHEYLLVLVGIITLRVRALPYVICAIPSAVFPF
jgi:hypothetical protein